MTINDLNNELSSHNYAFLCGNGFSINFDSGFSNIHSRLYENHKQISKCIKYEINSAPNFKKKLNDNYKSILKELKYISKDDFYKIFDDGIKFAKSIVECKGLEQELRQNGCIDELVFKKSQWTSLVSLYQQGVSHGAAYVNIEYWTILIYFYYAIKKINSKNYEFPSDNSFVFYIKRGNISPIILTTDENIYMSVLFNGFNTYFRILYSLTIYNNGKALSLSNQDRINNLNLENIRTFLNKYKTILSLNYDYIIEELTNKEVIHLHGQYIPNKKEYVLFQSIRFMKNNSSFISFSDILIGDWFVNKTFFHITSCQKSRNFNNKRILFIHDAIYDVFYKNHISGILIFGMNIDNDQDIIRYIALAFEKAGVTNPKIIYCYYKDKKEFLEFKEQFKASIKLGKVTKYAERIKLESINTEDILNDYFYK